MVYNVIITEHTEALLDKLVYYLIYRLQNEQAAEHLLAMISHVYDQLEENPFVYAESKDTYLKSMNYREALVPEMNYKVVFEVENKNVTVLGVFHQLEDYPDKM